VRDRGVALRGVGERVTTAASTGRGGKWCENEGDGVLSGIMRRDVTSDRIWGECGDFDTYV